MLNPIHDSFTEGLQTERMTYNTENLMNTKFK